jgi:hypothetical protein
MTKITVRKINFYSGMQEYCTVDSDKLGGELPRFYIQTDFCRLLPRFTVVNRTARVGYNGPVFIVEANRRKMVYDSNFEPDDRRYMLVRDFVEYVLSTNVCI